MVTRELTLYGTCSSAGEYPLCLDLISRGVIRVDPMMSAVAPLTDGAARDRGLGPALSAGGARCAGRAQHPVRRRGGAGAFRPHRHPGEQCRLQHPQARVRGTWEDWNTILDTNLRGPFFVAQAVARRMVGQGAARIINIGSVTSVAGYAGLGPYGASRGGIKQLSLAADWGPHGVTMNCLAPGWFKTAQNAVMYEDADWVSYLSEKIPLRRVPSTISTGLWSFWPAMPAAMSRPDAAGRRRHLGQRHPPALPARKAGR